VDAAAGGESGKPGTASVAKTPADSRGSKNAADSRGSKHTADNSRGSKHAGNSRGSKHAAAASGSDADLAFEEEPVFDDDDLDAAGPSNVMSMPGGAFGSKPRHGGGGGGGASPAAYASRGSGGMYRSSGPLKGSRKKLSGAGGGAAGLDDGRPNTLSRAFWAAAATAGAGERGSMAKRSPLVNARELEAPGVAVVSPGMVFFNEYGRDWSLDVFTLHHNALRKMVIDVCMALTAMMGRIGSLTVADVKTFFAAFRDVIKFQTLAFEVEEKKIFMWIETFMPLEGSAGREARSESRQRCTSLMEDIAGLEVIIVEGTSNDGFVQLVDKFNQFVSVILEMFNSIENEIPPVMSMFCTEDGKRQVDVDIRDYALKSTSAAVFFPALLDWCVGTTYEDEYINTHFKGAKKVTLQRWKKAYEAKHVRPIQALH